MGGGGCRATTGMGAGNPGNLHVAVVIGYTRPRSAEKIKRTKKFSLFCGQHISPPFAGCFILVRAPHVQIFMRLTG